MKIANRYRPFSHTPGTSCLIPSTRSFVTVYPTFIKIFSHFDSEDSIKWSFKGLVKDFTVMQDLEKQEVIVSGIAKQGYFCYRIYAKLGSIYLVLDKAPLACLEVELFLEGRKESKNLSLKSELLLKKNISHLIPSSFERISFGVSKAQDWDLVKRRQDPLEYLPFWFALGQQIPSEQEHHIEDVSTYRHLMQTEKLLSEKQNDGFIETLKEVFQAGFDGMLLPRLYDTSYLGVEIKSNDEKFSPPYSLLSLGYKIIKQMLLSSNGSQIEVLSSIPSCFHSGRALNLSQNGALFDLEWSKKQIKKIDLTVFEKTDFLFSFHKSIKSFRLSSKNQVILKACEAASKLCLEPGFYTFDQFQK